jgi:DNA repair exonuclease SbcCD ATPase subunit
MQFLSVDIKNFLSFQRETLKLDNLGLVLVQGQNLDSDAADGNGSGKSALIVEALLWCLFGRTARGIKGSSIVRKRSQDGCAVCVVWSEGYNTYSVIRYQDHQKGGNSLRFKVTSDVQSKDLTQTDKRRTQEQINKTLGFNYDVALHAMVLGQKSLSFAGATDATKKQIFETVLDFETLRAAEDRAKKQLIQRKEEKTRLESHEYRSWNLPKNN